MNPAYLNIGQSEPAVGYELGAGDAMAKQALERVLECLRRFRRTGFDTRTWTLHTRLRLEEKLSALRTLAGGPGTKQIEAELTAWEAHILQVIRQYMQEASETTRRIRTFNPPLTSSQLRPFIHAIESDRRETISALEPLTRTVEALSARKRKA